jgi:hypothetical protein
MFFSWVLIKSILTVYPLHQDLRRLGSLVIGKRGAALPCFVR